MRKLSDHEMNYVSGGQFSAPARADNQASVVKPACPGVIGGLISNIINSIRNFLFPKPVPLNK